MLHTTPPRVHPQPLRPNIPTAERKRARSPCGGREAVRFRHLLPLLLLYLLACTAPRRPERRRGLRAALPRGHSGGDGALCSCRRARLGDRSAGAAGMRARRARHLLHHAARGAHRCVAGVACRTPLQRSRDRCGLASCVFAEIVEPWTPGVATMELQPWLTTYDPLVRGPKAADQGAKRRSVPSGRLRARRLRCPAALLRAVHATDAASGHCRRLCATTTRASLLRLRRSIGTAPPRM